MHGLYASNVNLTFFYFFLSIITHKSAKNARKQNVVKEWQSWLRVAELAEGRVEPKTAENESQSWLNRKKRRMRQFGKRHWE